MKKKGISPLIATVLLIAFVVILAALLFDFGEEFFQGTVDSTQERIDTKMSCSSTNIEFLEISRRDEVCYNGTDVVFTLVNTDITEIESLKLIVSGNQSTLNVNLLNSYVNASEVGGPFHYVYDNTTYGTIKAVKIIPGIILEGSSAITYCAGRDAETDNVRTC